MRYIDVNEGTICGETPTLVGTPLSLTESNRPITGTVRRESLNKGSPQRSDNSWFRLYETMSE